MIITYHGVGSIKVQVGERVIGFSPIRKSKNHKPARFGADVALVALPHDSEWNGVEHLSYGEREPLALDGPGEYEAGEIFIEGLASTGPGGAINTVYSVTMDDIGLTHLGALASEVLPDETKEHLAAIDILFVPVGTPGLPPQSAAKLAVSLSPKLIIPIVHEGESDPNLKIFLKEIGATLVAGLDKLTIKKKDIVDQEAQVVVLKPQ